MGNNRIMIGKMAEAQFAWTLGILKQAASLELVRAAEMASRDLLTVSRFCAMVSG